MIAYLDTSALIKVYVAESGQELVIERLRAADQIATALITYVEMFAVLTRLQNERRITATEYLMLGEQLDANWSSYWVVDLTRAVVQRAARLAHRHALRGYDAVHYLLHSKSAGMMPRWNSYLSTGTSMLAPAARDF